MSNKSRRRATVFVILIAALICGTTASAEVITGTVTDSDTGQPIDRVTIRVPGTGRAGITNENGQYRLRLEPGNYRLLFSHVAYHTETISVTIRDTVATRDLTLKPNVILLPGAKIFRKHYDPAQEIIVEAIRHKEDLLNQIRDYSFQGYTRVTARELDDGKPEEWIIIDEKQIEGWFRSPDDYKQITTARRQSSVLDGDIEILTVGQAFNFNANRIDVGRQQIVSPTASDALDYYNYYLLDTVLMNDRRAFRLEIEPKSNAHALFDGEIVIIDSTYAVVGVDVGFNDGADFPYIEDLRFSQTSARFENDIWMPIEITITGNAHLPLPVIPSFTFTYIAALNGLAINESIPDDRFDEYTFEIAPGADDIDSATWDNGALVPLTEEEKRGFEFIDSVKNEPQSIPELVLGGVVGLVYIAEAQPTYDFVHFNRVEGPYLGIGWTFHNLVSLSELYVKNGWAFDGEYWQHHYRLTSQVNRRPHISLSIGYRDEIVSRPTIFASRHVNPTLVSLWSKMDPLDYYLEKGWEIGFSLKPQRKTRLDLSYSDLLQYSVSNVTTFGVFDQEDDHRLNPPIARGHLRALGATLTFDSRPLLRVGHRDDTLRIVPYTRLELGAEIADPDIIDNGFDYRRYWAEFRRVQRLPGWGVTTFFGYAGASDAALPPQRYFMLDYGDPDNIRITDFKTLDGTIFSGDRTVALYLGQDFGTTFFRKLHLPLLKELPFSFLLYGGAFWSEFTRQSISVPGEPRIAAPDWYSEIGFGFGRLPPILLRLYFTWQLSAYDSNNFSVKFGMGF